MAAGSLVTARGSRTSTITPANAIESITKALPYMISPSEAPVWNRSIKTQPTQLLHSYVTDALAATAMPTAQAVSDEPTVATTDNRTLKQNMVEINYAPYAISFWLELASNKGGMAGVSSEVRYALTKAMKELMKNIEFALTSEQAKVTTTTPKFAAFFDATDGCSTNVTDLGVDTTFAGITETALKDKLQAIFDDGGGDSGDLDMYMNSTVKRTLSDLLVGRANQITVNANTRTAFTALDVYQSPVGNFNLKLNADRNHNDSVSIIDHTKYRIGVFYPPTIKALDTDKVHKEGTICVAYTAEYHVEAAMGGWKHDNTST